MTIHRVWAFALVFLAACAAAAAQPGVLNDQVARTVSAHKLGAARVGISVVDLETGDVLADLNADVPFTPASNMKLLTTGAAALVLSPDFVFQTEIIHDGDRLIVRGSGDPALGDPLVLAESEPKLTVDDVLTALAGAAVKAGMQDVREVVLDDRVFDRELVHSGWPKNQLDRPYCAPVCGINFHCNVLSFFPGPNPQGPGTPPTCALQPQAPWVRVDIRARTIADGRNTAWITREQGPDRYALRGDIRFQTQQPIEITCQEPALFFGRLLAHNLTKAGVRVAQGPQGPVVRLAEAQEQLSGTTIAIVNTPLTDVLRRCNADSENLYAEALLKRIGHAVTKDAGSWNNGASVLRMVLGQRLSPQHAAATTISDGSGLSRTNLVSPTTLTRWLGELNRDEKVRGVFTDSLATPGTGTLKKRFRDAKLKNEVRAKSGYIEGVRCLSGYVINNSTGRRVAFSVMVNDITNDVQTRAALDLHEEIVKLADTWLARKAAAEPAKIGG
jgi:D-alanyl-D-alanine carboxypeptidase/D-alanyl-D-alanine-endopeptidase (penicillin-binding protein 4)